MTCTPLGDRCFYIDYVDNWRNIYEYSVAAGTRSAFIVDRFTVLAIYGYSATANEMCVHGPANRFIG